MNWNLGQSQFLSGQQARMTADDHANFINHDRLTKPEFLYRGRHFADGLLGNLACVPRVRNNFFYGPHFNSHIYFLHQRVKIRMFGSAYRTSAYASMTASALSGDLTPLLRASSFDSITT